MIFKTAIYWNESSSGGVSPYRRARPMPGACLNSWQSNCDWTLGYLWHSCDFIQRGMFIALALMLAYTAYVFIRFSYRYYSLRRGLQDSNPDLPSSRQASASFLAELIPSVSMLRGIASAAPFLGLAGTCYGFLASFQDVSGSRSSVTAYLIRVIVNVPVSTLTGILTAIPAVFSYSLLRARLETVGRQISISKADSNLGAFHFAQALPLKKRLSVPPAYALLAAPVLASVVALFMPFHPYRIPTGLSVALPSTNCDAWRHPPDVPNRVIVLRITNTGDLFLNWEAEDGNSLGQRLSDIYRLRKYRDLYLLAEDEVPFQTVAGAIDIARNSITAAPGESEMRVILITPQAQAESEKCIVIKLNRPGRHFLRK